MKNDSSVASDRDLHLQAVLGAFGIEGAIVTPFGSGLINHTWKVAAQGENYILQRINQAVFKHPADIAYNIERIAVYLAQHAPGYLFVRPVDAINNGSLVQVGSDACYRLFPFVAHSFTKDVVETPGQAFEAAAQFGKFTRLLSGFDARQLKTTIPHFHNLDLRYRQFLAALQSGQKERLLQSGDLVKQLSAHAAIVAEYNKLIAHPHFKLRVTHHDTKISNVLFDKWDKGLCVIDLDTVMPGYFISDVGDMMRTYLSPVSEEEEDVSKIGIRDEFYAAIVEGYFAEMETELTAMEKGRFLFAGKCMIYMQALRFLTDHLNGDVYYGARYEGHNFVRARNQATLLEKLIQKQDVLEKQVQVYR